MVRIRVKIGGSWESGTEAIFIVPNAERTSPYYYQRQTIETAQSIPWFNENYTLFGPTTRYYDYFQYLGFPDVIYDYSILLKCWVAPNKYFIPNNPSGNTISFRFYVDDEEIVGASFSSSLGFYTLPYVDENSVGYRMEVSEIANNRHDFALRYDIPTNLSALYTFWHGVAPVPEVYNITYHLVNATGDPNNPTSIPVGTTTLTTFRFYPAEFSELKYASVIRSTPGEPIPTIWNRDIGLLQVGIIDCNITIEVIGVGDPYPIDPSDPTDPPDPSSPDYDLTTTPIPLPNNPTWSYGNAGFSNVYLPTEVELNRLALYLWSDSFDADNFKKMFDNPMEAIMGCHLVPLSLDDIRHTSGTLAYGNNDTTISMCIATDNWVEFDCGSIQVPVYYGAYLSYSPYTKVQIYLPYVGTHYLQADSIVGKYVHVVYKIDIVSGACVAFVCVGEVLGDETVMYQFTGSCSAEIPVTQGDYKNILQTIQSVVSSSVGIVGSAITGGNSKTGNGLTKSGVAGLIGGAASTIESIGSSVEGMIKPDITMSGNVSSTAGYLGMQTPYLLIITPRVCLPEEQQKYIGLPTYITEVLGNLTGYTQCEIVHLEGFSLTEPELQELHDMLQEGVIF